LRATGTGGSFIGTASYLREMSDGRVKIASTYSCGARLVSWFNDGVLKTEGDSITEGIGQDRVTAAIGDNFKPDHQITDSVALKFVFGLMQT
jgi:cysteine synthase